MPTLSTFCEGIFYNGGIVAAGAILVALNKWEYLPRYTYPVSIGVLAVGSVGLFLKFRRVDPDSDPDHDARMAEFYRLRPILEQQIRDRAILHLEAQRMTERWIPIYNMQNESEIFEQIISDYQRRKALAVAQGIPFDIPGNIYYGMQLQRHSLQLELARFSTPYRFFQNVINRRRSI